jgi:hypothetical protein
MEMLPFYGFIKLKIDAVDHNVMVCVRGVKVSSEDYDGCSMLVTCVLY